MARCGEQKVQGPSFNDELKIAAADAEARKEKVRARLENRDVVYFSGKRPHDLPTDRVDG